MRLIESKLTTPDLWPAVPRERLLRTLDESVDRGTSTLVTGRSGTGKTTLVVDYARRTLRRVAWYDVDASDDSPSVFFAYLLEAIGRQRPGFGAGPSPLADVTERDDMHSVANLFVYELLERAGPPLLVVLDNLHRVYDAAWTAPFLVRLLPLLPFDTHLLMIGRGLPPAPLWRLRSKQALHVIEEATLAFVPGEVRELTEFYRQDRVDPRDVLQFTHGRAALVDAVAREGLTGAAHEQFLRRLQAWR